MNELHEMYAAVTAKRPELTVPGLRSEVCGRCSHAHPDWYRGPDDSDFVADDVAAALIRSHWHDQLPDRHQLVRSGSDWSVKEGVNYFGWHGSAIEALGHFYLEHA